MLRLLLLALLACGFVARTEAAEGKRPPNVVLILADDMGWRDIGYNRSEIKTPHLDRLAAAGVILQRHYVYPTCSPTRACLLTGRTASRFGIHGPIGGRSTQALPRTTLTLPALLKRANYETAITGKWHLGLRPEVGPLQYGFDQSYGYLHGQIDQYTHLYKNGDRTWHRNDKFLDEKGHATDLIAADAVRFVSSKRTRPFFLYVAFSVPHTPLQEEKRWLAPYEKTIKSPSRQMFAASVTHMDDAVGQIVAALKKADLLDNTLIVFVSDNGGQRSYSSKTDYDGKHGPYPILGDNRPWRGWKGELYEGGIRVPAFAYWQGRLKPHIVPHTTLAQDWLPTLAQLAGVEVPAKARVEGQSIWPLLTAEEKSPRPRRAYWNVGSASALMDGDWKLLVNKRKGTTELYNLATDPEEKTDLAAKEPEKLKALSNALSEEQKSDP